MAENIIEFTNSNSGDIREMIVEQVVDAHNEAVSAVIEFKEQGDVEDKQDEILASVEAVAPTSEQKEAKRNSGEDDEDPFTLENYKFLAEAFKKQMESAQENLKAMAYEQAKAGINSEYDIDLGRARIKELRAEWSKSYSPALEMLKMTKSIVEEVTTDEDGKTTKELVGTDKFGELLLKAGSVPSIRVKRGEGSSSPANSEGAKIRAWGKENGWADIADRGPLPTELKDAYATAHNAS